ncbi:MAG: phosphotransferase [Planctomycetota bacterium]
MEEPQVVRMLKRDQLGSVELLDGPAGPAVRRIAGGGRVPGSRGVALLLRRRERIALARLDGVPGVARLLDLPAYAAAPAADGTPPRRAAVLLRTWLAGVPLHAAERLPADFFDRLADLVRGLHARGVCHNDLHKEPNVIVAPDGRPQLVDFQLASVHPRGGRTFRVRAREDLRHVAKLRSRYLAAGGRAAEVAGGAGPGRRSPLAAAWRHLGKPVYNLVTRRLLHAADGEPRRPATGPWPRWDPPLEAR